MRLLRALAGPLVLSSVVLSCSETDVGSPFTFEPASVAVSLEFAPGLGAGGARSAYQKTNRLDVRFDGAGGTRDRQVVPFVPADTATHTPMSVRLRRPTEALDLGVEIRVADNAVFRGTTAATLRAGRTTSVTVELQPVVAAVAGPAGLPVMTAYGDTMPLSGVALFVTGDTIDGLPVTWTSLDPDVATADADGTVVSRSDGAARLVARYGEFTDTVHVAVLATVAGVIVSPPDAVIPVGATRQFSATPIDRRGNPVPGRTVSWSTTDASVLTIDQTGLALAVGVGTARVVAAASEASGEADATAPPGPPLTENLLVSVTGGPITARFDASVFPNGGSTETWFEWGPVSLPSPPSLTLKRNVGDGLLSVPVSTTVPGLAPATEYSVRIVATNPAGRHESETIFFTTPTLPPSAQTLPVSGPTPPYVTLNGSVSGNGTPAVAWFEWGADSTAAVQSTPAEDVGAGARHVLAIVPSGIPGTTWYYRVAARHAGGTAYGAFLSWSVPPPHGPLPEAVTLPATIVGEARALLNGTADPNGLAAQAWFEYGTDPTLTVFSTTAEQAVGSGSDPVAFSATVTSLLLQSAHYYRAVVRTANGFARGAIIEF